MVVNEMVETREIRIPCELYEALELLGERFRQPVEKMAADLIEFDIRAELENGFQHLQKTYGDAIEERIRELLGEDP